MQQNRKNVTVASVCSSCILWQFDGGSTTVRNQIATIYFVDAAHVFLKNLSAERYLMMDEDNERNWTQTADLPSCFRGGVLQSKPVYSSHISLEEEQVTQQQGLNIFVKQMITHISSA